MSVTVSSLPFNNHRVILHKGHLYYFQLSFSICRNQFLVSSPANLLIFNFSFFSYKIWESWEYLPAVHIRSSLSSVRGKLAWPRLVVGVVRKWNKHFRVSRALQFQICKFEFRRNCVVCRGGWEELRWGLYCAWAMPRVHPQRQNHTASAARWGEEPLGENHFTRKSCGWSEVASKFFSVTRSGPWYGGLLSRGHNTSCRPKGRDTKVGNAEFWRLS